jgi:hypothetical protein
MENPDDVGFILTILSVCPRALMFGIANDILVGNLLLLILKEMVRTDVHNWILSIRIVFYKVENFRCYAVLVQTSYEHVLPPPEVKGS